MRYVFRVKESNGFDNEKILSSLHWPWKSRSIITFLHDLVLPSGCKHDTKLILVSILTFSRALEDIESCEKKSRDLDGWPWNSRSHTIHCMTFHISGWIQATDLILVSILTSGESQRISENPKEVTWPWNVWPWKSRSNTFWHDLSYLRLQTWYEVDL